MYTIIKINEKYTDQHQQKYTHWNSHWIDELDWIELDWIGLNWIELNWNIIWEHYGTFGGMIETCHDGTCDGTIWKGNKKIKKNKILINWLYYLEFYICYVRCFW